jgi:NAD(P)-dependent dehydrogenase (short-subunit alcohol dehydrogenase family)
MRDRTLFWLAAAGSAALIYGLTRNLRQLDLRGKVVLITGGSRGLGFLLAQEFSREGARVSFCARHPEELHKAQAELEKSGVDVYPISCDVGDREQVERMIADVTETLGGLDILVNNAGIMEVAPIEIMDLDNFERAMQIMFWGPLYAIRAVLPSMIARQSGTIVNITSIGGKLSFPHLLPYCAAKYAFLGLSEGLSAELEKSGIQVVSVVPGFMRTGSYLNAYFAGEREREFGWFSLGATLPLISMDARRAARQIIRSVKNGDTQPILSVPANLAARFHGLFPATTNRLLALVGRMLPGTGERDFQRGGELQGEIDSTLFQEVTKSGREAARKYQQGTVPEV